MGGHHITVLLLTYIIVDATNRPQAGRARLQARGIYWMLAYCAAAVQPSRLLIYAAGENASGEQRINHAGKTIEVASLVPSGPTGDILREVGRLADRVRDHACRHALSAVP